MNRPFPERTSPELIDDGSATYRPGRLQAGPAQPVAEGSVLDLGTFRPGGGLTPSLYVLDDSPLSEVPGYRLGEELGRGGMGVVYRATDIALQRTVAVKVLLGTDGDGSAAQRFLDEARITGQLQHPGIPSVYQVGVSADGRPFLALKLIQGTNLAQRLSSQAPVDTSAVMEAIARAVGYAHAEGVIHRDLKPGNVMIGAFGEVQVMDWGLAKRLADPDEAPRLGRPATAEHSATQDGTVLGTLAYIAPEQAAGRGHEVDARSDVFGLGAILCVMLTGKPPYEGATIIELCMNAVTGNTLKAFERLAGCAEDPGLVELCRRCLSADRDARPADGTAVADAIALFRRTAADRARIAELAHTRALVEADEGAKRRRTQVWAARGIAAVLLLGLVGTGVGYYRACLAKQDAHQKQADAENAHLAEAAERAEAEARTKEARSLLKFFREKVLSAARPRGLPDGLGRDVTVRAAVVASLPAIPKQFADQPLIEAQLRQVVGTTFIDLSDFKAAAEQLERSCALFRAHRGDEHIDTLRAANNLAICYEALERHDEAFRLRRTVYEAGRAGRGPDDPDTLNSQTNLAVSLDRRGEFAAAMRLYEEVLARRKKVMGERDADTLIAATNLAESYGVAGRFDEALRVYEATMPDLRAANGPFHPDTLRAEYNLAILFEKKTRYEDSLRLMQALFPVVRNHLGDEHDTTILTGLGVANSFYNLKRYAEALPQYDLVTRLAEAKHGPRHPTALRVADLASACLTMLLRHAEALPRNEALFAARTAALGPNDLETIHSQEMVARGLLLLGQRVPEALVLLDGVIAHGQRKAGRNHGERMWTLLDIRLRHFERTHDAAECRATARMLDAYAFPAPARLYDSACFHAVAAAQFQRGGHDIEANAEAEVAMQFLAKAVKAGYDDRANVATDTDVDALRSRADFQAMFPPPPERAPAPRKSGM